MAAERILIVVSYLCGFLQLCSANSINCTVTQDADQTTYSIPDVKASHCEYSWTNSSGTSNHVLANHNKKMDEFVKSTTISTLITSACFDKIISTRNCISEGIEYKATCTTSCIKNRFPQANKDWIAAIVVILLLVMMGLAGFLCYRHKKKLAACTGCTCLLPNDSWN